MFDETLGTMLSRSRNLSMSLDSYIDNERLLVQQIDPAEMSPGQFATLVREAVEDADSSMIVIDSLNAYMQAMPGHRHLLLGSDMLAPLLSFSSRQRTR